jgi:outer membrane receptor protein involved in Fe transport
MYFSFYVLQEVKNMKENLGVVIFLFLLAIPSQAQVIEEIIVWGRSTDMHGNAHSASEGLVEYSDLSTRPLMRVGELTEVIPGMIATQHSGTGKANQYFLRGMNLDHGSDFSVSLDGLPVNFRTHAHAQGYLDLNIMIPELIERVQFRKGPYFADLGDFSLAGSANFKTYGTIESPFIEIQMGSHEDYRVVAATSSAISRGDLLLAGELHYRNGPWELKENLEKVNLLFKLTSNSNGISQSSIASIYNASWMGTDQIPLRHIANGNSRFAYIDPDIGGESYRYSWIHRKSNDLFSLGYFVSAYGMNLYSNPTYYLNDEENGDEIEQEDQRLTYGSSGYRYVSPLSMPENWDIRIGYDFIVDHINKLNLFHNASRIRLSPTKSDSAKTASLSIYLENEMVIARDIRARVGYRIDHYRYDVVDNILMQNSGYVSETLGQPKLALAYTLSDVIELYIGWGKGFHSNDARGTTIHLDPSTQQPVDMIDIFAAGKGSEIGLRYERDETFNATINYFTLDLDSELIFVGDAGTTEPTNGSRRRGIEFSYFWEMTSGLAFDMSGSKTHGNYTGVPINQRYIPDAHDLTLSSGVTSLWRNGSSATLRLRHFGGAPLTEDNSITKDGTTLLNFAMSIPFAEDQITFEILNILDAKDSDISYYFESRLPQETEGSKDLHFHPVESRAFKISYRKLF